MTVITNLRYLTDDYDESLKMANQYCKELSQLVEAIRSEYGKDLGTYSIEEPDGGPEGAIDLDIFNDPFEIEDFVDMVRGYKAYLDLKQ